MTPHAVYRRAEQSGIYLEGFGSIVAVKAGSDSIRAKLAAAAANTELVRVVRSIRRADKLEGFVLKIGAEWLLLHVLNPAMFLDGHVAVRVSDVRSVKTLGSDSFAARALRHYGDKPRKLGKVELRSTKAVIASASKTFSLVTIHIEQRDPSVCYIGMPVALSTRALRLREISSEARWDDEPTTYWLRDVTRVDIGGRYERALLAVGGRATKVKPD